MMILIWNKKILIISYENWIQVLTWPGFFWYNILMQANHTKQDILKELKRRFNIIDYGGGNFSLRTKNNWMIYYTENGNSLDYYKSKSVLKNGLRSCLVKRCSTIPT